MAIRYRNESERLMAEQAVLAYREVLDAAQHAEHGQGMMCMEQATLEAGRRQMCLMLEHAASAHPEAQKKGHVHRAAGVVPSVNSKDIDERPL